MFADEYQHVVNRAMSNLGLEIPSALQQLLHFQLNKKTMQLLGQVFVEQLPFHVVIRRETLFFCEAHSLLQIYARFAVWTSPINHWWQLTPIPFCLHQENDLNGWN